MGSVGSEVAMEVRLHFSYLSNDSIDFYTLKACHLI